MFSLLHQCILHLQCSQMFGFQSLIGGINNYKSETSTCFHSDSMSMVHLFQIPVHIAFHFFFHFLGARRWFELVPDAAQQNISNITPPLFFDHLQTFQPSQLSVCFPLFICCPSSTVFLRRICLKCLVSAILLQDSMHPSLKSECRFHLVSSTRQIVHLSLFSIYLC